MCPPMRAHWRQLANTIDPSAHQSSQPKWQIDRFIHFWATIYKPVRRMLSDRCLSVCPVCNVGVLWPNGWMDQDETWRAGRPRPWSHCITWGPRYPSPKGAQPLPNFRPIPVVDKRLDGSRCHLVRRYASAQATLCYMGTQLLPQKEAQPPIFDPCLL